MSNPFKRNISSVFLLYCMGLLLFAFLLMGITYSYFEIKDFEKEAALTKERFLESQKNLIKNETEKAVDLIKLSRTIAEENHQNLIREKVEIAWNIANNIYEINKNNLPKDQIKKLITDALRPLRFFNDRGYIFIVSLDGVEELFPVSPEFEGKNLLKLKDAKGNYAIQDEIKLIKKQKEGFITNYWKKPGFEEGMIHEKISYIKHYEPLNWYIGCGDYKSDIKQEIQNSIKEEIRKLRFGKNGYIFINTYRGDALLMDGEVIQTPKNVWELKDPNGVKVIQEERKAVENPNGDFIYYSWRKLVSLDVAPKMSFVKGIEDWQWMVGAGVYIDEVDEQIELQRNKLNKSLLKSIATNFIVIVFIFLLLLYLTHRISKRIKRNFTLFTKELKHAVEDGVEMDPEVFKFKDIQSILLSINEMIVKERESKLLLEESEIKFRAIFENVPVFIIVHDTLSGVNLCNKEFMSYFSPLNDGENIHTFFDIYANSEKSKEQLKKILQLNEFGFYEIEMHVRKETRVQNWASFQTKSKQIIAVGYDITLLKNNEAELKELNNTKDKILSIISHDLQGPFNAIIGFSDMLIKKYDKYPEEKKLQYIKSINASSKGMHKMLINLLAWVRGQSGKLIINNEKFNLKKSIDNLLNILEPQAEKKYICIFNAVDESIVLHSDISMIETILHNLIANAIKFTPSHGEIRISSKNEFNEVEICVEDSGIGMDEKVINHLFDNNEKKLQTGTANEKGTGIGLIICKDHIHSLGGKIWVESKKNKGSKFYFSIPNLIF